MPAAEIEGLVIRSVREHLKLPEPVDDRVLINTHIARVEVQPEQLVIKLTPTEKLKRHQAADKVGLRIPLAKAPIETAP